MYIIYIGDAYLNNLLVMRLIFAEDQRFLYHVPSDDGQADCF